MALDVLAYARQLRALLPFGDAWDNHERDSILTSVLLGAAEELARIDARGDDLLREMNPARTLEMLPEWEDALSLPDPCLPEPGTVQARREAVVAKLTTLGGQSRAFFIALAETLGYTITITEFKPFTIGSHVGESLTNGPWAFAWQVNAPGTTTRSFKVGQSVVGERLRTWGNEQLECAISQRKPAHTVVLFAYGT